MKRIISLFLTVLCLAFTCIPLYSCESTEGGVLTGRQFAHAELVCSSMLLTSSVNPYETLDFNYVETARVKDFGLYVSPDLKLFSTIVYENDIQSVWDEIGTLSKSSLDLKLINSETKWSEGHSLQHITENVESVYSLTTDTDKTTLLILLKDRTAYLAVCFKYNEMVYLLKETDVSYNEDLKRSSFEVFNFSVSGNSGEYLLYSTKILCLYNNRTEFFLQCAENNTGGIHGKVTETRDGLLLETPDGKYKITLNINDENLHFTVETPNSIKFTEEIESNTGNNVKKVGEYYYSLEQNSGCFDTWGADFDGDGNKEYITFHAFPTHDLTRLSTTHVDTIPPVSFNAAVWENGEIKYFLFLPFENKISDIRFHEESGELFAEVDKIKYRKHHYGVSRPDSWEPYTETVIYKVTVDENGLDFEKVQKTA